MASAQAWSIKKRWASKFKEFLRTSSVGHLAVSLIRGDCVYMNNTLKILFFLKQGFQSGFLTVFKKNHYFEQRLAGLKSVPNKVLEVKKTQKIELASLVGPKCPKWTFGPFYHTISKFLDFIGRTNRDKFL